VGAAVSLGLAVAGALLAHQLYNVPEPVEHTQRLGGIRDVLFNNYYQDEYQVWLADTVTMGVARISDLFDQNVVDGVVNGVSAVSLASGRRVRRIQRGVVTDYALLLSLGLTVLVVVLGILGGWFA
jgi:NADH-quinone oxidoreductase subunit L